MQVVLKVCHDEVFIVLNYGEKSTTDVTSRPVYASTSDDTCENENKVTKNTESENKEGKKQYDRGSEEKNSRGDTRIISERKTEPYWGVEQNPRKEAGGL